MFLRYFDVRKKMCFWLCQKAYLHIKLFVQVLYFLCFAILILVAILKWIRLFAYALYELYNMYIASGMEGCTSKGPGM